METVIDRFGRVIIPKKIRDDLELRPGTILRVEEGKREILLKPLEGESHLVVKNGILVFTGKAAGDLMSTVRRNREERIKKFVPKKWR